MSAALTTEYSAVSQNPQLAQFDIEESSSKTKERRLTRGFCTRDMGGLKVGYFMLGGVFAVGAILLVVLLPMSFHGLDYYEYGFKKRKTTGEIDRNKAYGVGKHVLGPDYEFKIFPADAHFEQFNRITIFAADNLQVTISCQMQYFLRQHQLAMLHKTFDINYAPVLRNNALDALKSAAVEFEVRQYMRERAKIEEAVFQAVRNRLGGPCCLRGCNATQTCETGCKEYDTCTEEDFGLFADVRYFQLQELDIPNSLEQKFLNQLEEQQRNEREKYNQEALLVRKETDAMINAIENEAREVANNAAVTSKLLSSKAVADATAVVEQARSTGLKHLYSELKIDSQEEKTTFDYLRTLRGKDNVHLTIDYNQLIAGPLKP